VGVGRYRDMRTYYRMVLTFPGRWSGVSSLA